MQTQSRAIDPSTGEPIVELIPQVAPGARVAAVRVVGPGRREREYLDRVAALEASLGRELDERRARERELALAALCERGARRAADRMERDCERLRREREVAQAAHNRMILALGALQRENELLRKELALSAGRARPALAERVESDAVLERRDVPRAPRARAWWRWFQR